ncbi:MAG: HD domain-containing phosphohydrolase [Phycisphaeraceae bacterium]
MSFSVMVVDDDAVTREILNEGLVDAGYEVMLATNGQEAADMLQQHHCPIIISDWMMPELDGLSLCRALRAHSDSYVYFMLMTSRSNREDRMTALNAGVDDFLAKPVDQAELCARMRNARRLLSLETREVAIFALAKLAESRDPETGSHLERVRSYSRVLTERLRQHGVYADQVDEEFVRLIYLTSPLHDIGKVGIPDRILLKPGRLNDHEFDAMKLHTLVGAETLGALAEQFPGANFLRMAHEIAISHHERWDGSGYPHGLKGEAIPLAGRIVALADVYDALISKRVYKSAFSHTVAQDMIIEEAGKHFDPALVKTFENCAAELEDIHRRYSEDDHSKPHPLPADPPKAISSDPTRRDAELNHSGTRG